MNDLDIEGLVGSVLRGALGGGRKRKRGALSYLAGGRSSFLNASTLLTVAGVAWGLWESAQAGSATPVTTPAPGATTGARARQCRLRSQVRHDRHRRAPDGSAAAARDRPCIRRAGGGSARRAPRAAADACCRACGRHARASRARRHPDAGAGTGRGAVDCGGTRCAEAHRRRSSPASPTRRRARTCTRWRLPSSAPTRA